MWNSGSLVYSYLQNVLLKDFKANYTSEGRKKCKSLSNIMVKEVESLDDHGCPKIQELVESDKNVVWHQLPFPTQGFTSWCRTKGKSV